jgi:hypothetical protein
LATVTLNAVFRRRTAADASAQVTAEKAEGKGRPTPTRKESEAARLAKAKPPRDRKEAARLERARRVDARRKAQTGLAAGDERFLSPRDQGPVKGYVRDFIDARLNVGEFFLFGAIAVFALGITPSPFLRQWSVLLWLVMIVMIVVDTLWLTFRLRREVARRFPDESTRGLTVYALMRSLQIRRLRIPRPRVKRGQAI